MTMPFKRNQRMAVSRLSPLSRQARSEVPKMTGFPKRPSHWQHCAHHIKANTGTGRPHLLPLPDSGERPLTRSLAFWQNIGELGNINRGLAKRVEDHQREGKAKPAAIDSVNQYLVGHEHTIGLQPQGKLLVGDLFGLAKLFDEGFRPGLVVRSGLQFGQSYIGFDVSIVEAVTVLKPNKSNSIYV